MTAYRLVYDSRHLQADCKEPGSAPEPYARQSSMDYLYLFLSVYHMQCLFALFTRTFVTCDININQSINQSISQSDRFAVEIYIHSKISLIETESSLPHCKCSSRSQSSITVCLQHSCKNGWTDRDAVCRADWRPGPSGPRVRCKVK